MAISLIKCLRINDEELVQSINTSTDTVHFTLNDFTLNSKMICSIDCSGYLTKAGEEKYLGMFSLTRQNVWVFCFFNDNFVSVNNCDKVTTTMYDLIDAEMYVVQELIKRNVLEV